MPYFKRKSVVERQAFNLHFSLLKDPPLNKQTNIQTKIQEDEEEGNMPNK